MVSTKHVRKCFVTVNPRTQVHGLPFFLRPLDELLFEMGLLSRGACSQDGLVFKMGFFSRRGSFRDGLLFEVKPTQVVFKALRY